METNEISPNEYKVLNYIKNLKDVPEESIDIDSDKRIISSSISYLEFKNLINVQKISLDSVSITEEGKKYIKNGFPEEILYNFLVEKKTCSMKDIINYMGENYKIAIANIAKLGIKPVNGKMELHGEMLKDIFHNKKMELSGIENGKIPDNAVLDDFS